MKKFKKFLAGLASFALLTSIVLAGNPAWYPSGNKAILVYPDVTQLCNSSGALCSVIGGGATGGVVTTVFGRNGDVLAIDGDYEQSEITGLKTTDAPTFSGATITNQIEATTFSGALVGDVTGDVNSVTLTAAGSGTGYLSNDGSYSEIVSGVTSVFTRTGAVIATSGDYTASEVTNVATGDIVATDVQSAIDELDDEKMTNENPVDQTVWVSKGGNDSTCAIGRIDLSCLTIQAAIDLITDNSTSKRYSILIHPGEYAENVIMEEYVSIYGVGDHVGTTITASSGITLTMPPASSAVNLRDISIENTGSGGTAILFTTGFGVLYDVYVSWINSDNGASGTLADLQGGIFSMYGGKLRYNGGGDSVGVVTHEPILLSGSANTKFKGVAGDLDFEDVDDNLYAFSSDITFINDVDIENGEYLIDALNVAYDGNVQAIRMVDDIDAITVKNTTILMSSAGNGTGTAVLLDSISDNKTVSLTSSIVSVTGFVSNYRSNIATGDTITFGGNHVTAAEVDTGAGTAINNGCVVNGDYYIDSDMHAAYLEFDDVENTYIGLDKVFPTYFAFANDVTNFWLGNAGDPNIWMNYEKDADIILGQGTGGDTDIIISEGSTNKTTLNQDGVDFKIQVGVNLGDIVLQPDVAGGVAEVVIGDNSDANFSLTFDADTNDGVITWDEDNDVFLTDNIAATTFNGALTGNVTGNCSGSAGTVSTITGLAPDTATTQATQPNITSATGLAWTGLKTGTDGEVPTFDASGNPVFVAASTSGYVLTSNGPGAAPEFKTSSAYPEGTDVISTGVSVGWVLQADGDNTSSWVALGGGGDALTSNPLSQFAATTSAQLAGVLSDESGTDKVAFTTSPVFTTPNIGSATGDISGNAGTVSTITGLAPDTATTAAAQPNITSVGTLTALNVDNININGNDISSTAGTDLNITPLAGQQIVLDGTIVIDAGEVTGGTSATFTDFIGNLTGNADTCTGYTPASGSLTLAGADAVTLTTTNATNVTLPTTGTLGTLAGTEELTNKTVTDGTIKDTIGFDAIDTVTYNVTTTTADWSSYNVGTMTFGAGNIGTFAFTDPTQIGQSIKLILIQDGTGGRTVTAWDSDIKWAGGTAPTLSTGIDDIDVVTCIRRSADYLCAASLDFS